MNEVSIYIPCHNTAETISSCFEAVFKQTHPLKEVLVIDDGSNDGTVEIVSRYPVKLIRHKENQGLAASRNMAIRNITTEFAASLDADCLPESGWLEQLMKKFSSSEIAGAGGKLVEKYSSSACDFWRSVHMKQHWGETENKPPFLFGSNTVFRKKALVNIGLYKEDYRDNYEDVDISSRLKKAGYILVYEPKAIARHLKKDNIYSLLNTYWKWDLGHYQESKYYVDPESFIFKIKNVNFDLGNRYIKEDISSGRHQLIYLDFLLTLHHSLRDLEYFISQDDHNNLKDYSLLSFWLSLLDLTFFYHFDYKKVNLSTLIPKRSAFLQNFFALDLILGRFIRKIFKGSQFSKRLYKHLLLSVYKIDDTHLLDKLLNLIELHKYWDGFIERCQPNLNILFLENLFFDFKKWFENLRQCYPDIIQMIEISAEETDKS